MDLLSEVDWSGLKRVARVMDLLGEVKRVMHCYSSGTCIVLSQTQIDSNKLCRCNLLSVEGTLCTDMLEMGLLSTQPRRLLFLRAVDCSQDDAVVVLALPAEVGRRLAAHNVRTHLTPQLSARAQLSRSVTYMKIHNCSCILSQK